MKSLLIEKFYLKSICTKMFGKIDGKKIILKPVRIHSAAYTSFCRMLFIGPYIRPSTTA